jgi:aminopeptidase-like protein
MTSLLAEVDRQGEVDLGRNLYDFAAALFPICRSITGDGVRQTLARLQERLPLEISEVPSGTQVLDWTVPKEWNIRDAYIRDAAGHKVVDFRDHNLHVLNYSVPVRAKLCREQLKCNLFTLPDRPEWIPYRTAYYEESWGFCLTHRQWEALADGEYEVYIDATLQNGSLTYGDLLLPGSSSEEVLISCHVCHPSLANDNLSGIAVASKLAELLSGVTRRYSYRFLFIPGTIGAITWLARNPEAVSRIRHGLVLTCLGDAGGFHYKKSRRGNAEIDRAAAVALRHQAEPFEILDFSPYGYDERQYCSPGFNLATGCLMRSVWGTFPEYHTSADNLDFIKPEKLAGSLRLCAAIMDVLEKNRRYRNLQPWGEPQLGRRNLYPATGGEPCGTEMLARLWVLNLSDGEHSLLDIAERSGLPFTAIQNAAEVLQRGGLLSVIEAKGAEAAAPATQGPAAR